MNAPTPGHPSITDEAAEWLVRCHAGFTPADASEFQRWLSADPQRVRAFAEVEATWRTLNQPRAGGHASELAHALNLRGQRRSQRRNIRAALTVGFAAAAAIALAFAPLKSRVAFTNTPSTVVIRPDRSVLPDGSVVELNAGAEIAVEYTPAKRGVRLLRGEALFSVAKDAAHPFVVTSGGVEVRAVGTAFSVRRDATQTNILVTEGRVAVERVAAVAGVKSEDATSPGPVYLPAGSRLVVPAAPSTNAALQGTPVAAEEIASALAWRGQRVEFTGTSLADAIELFNRQNRVKLSTTDPAVAQFQISGIFWADDPDGFVRLLESGMNVRAERSLDAITLHRQ